MADRRELQVASFGIPDGIDARFKVGGITGFTRVFGLRLVPACDEAHIELPGSVERDILDAKRPHLRLADILTNTMNRLGAFKHEFDLVMIFLPDRWEPAFYGEADDFDLHD